MTRRSRGQLSLAMDLTTLPYQPTSPSNSPAGLDPLSVDELHERIAALKAEIARVEAHIAAVTAHRSAAEELFKKG